MNEYLFSYGTLQKEKVQLEIFHRLLIGAKDSLKGHKLYTVEITDASFLARGEQRLQITAVPSGNSTDSIEGTVYEVSGQELDEADKYEPDRFKRKQVTLHSGKKAWIYTATP